jgi:hypothetical protein
MLSVCLAASSRAFMRLRSVVVRSLPTVHRSDGVEACLPDGWRSTEEVHPLRLRTRASREGSKGSATLPSRFIVEVTR